MKLQWLGHSAFRMVESTGTAIICDPFNPAHVGYGMAYLTADAITSSHGHPGHNNFSGVKGNPVIINSVSANNVSGVKITSVESFHDDSEGKKRGKNIIFKYRIDGIDIVHLGDIGCECTPDLIEQLVPVDILLLPVGGKTTIEPETAKDYVDALMPNLVIPMHFKTEHCDADLLKLDAFLRLFDDEEIEYLDAHTMLYERDDFDMNNGTKIIVPKRFKG